MRVEAFEMYGRRRIHVLHSKEDKMFGNSGDSVKPGPEEDLVQGKTRQAQTA